MVGLNEDRENPMSTENVQTINRKLAQSFAIFTVLAGFILLQGTGSALREQPFEYLSLVNIIYGLTLGLLMYLIKLRRFHGSSH